MERVAQLLFGPFRLDPQKKQLWRGDTALELRPMSVSVLQVLLEHAGEVLTKEQLLRSVWAKTHVSHTALKVCIREIRETLGDERTDPRYIETVGREGYRFIGTQEQESESLALAGEVAGVEYIVGRQRELAQLEEWFRKARRGALQIVFVTGEAGIGKTTLVDLFLARIRNTARVRVGRGQCSEHHGEGEAYLPILEAFSRLCREPGTVNLISLLGQYAPTWLIQMPAMLDNEGLTNLQQRTQGATLQRMLREMADVLEAVTVEIPLVLVLEDLHWSDNSTLDLISYLAQRQDRTRLMMIGTYRPTDLKREGSLKKIKHELQIRQKCEEIPLKPLNRQEVATYIAKCFPDQMVSTGFTKVIHHRTEGNALFMVTLVNELASQGVIVEKDGKWEIQNGTAELNIPESLRQVIEQKFVHLKLEERQVLEAASVEGGEFSAAVIATATGKEAIEVEDHCADLVRQGQFIQGREALHWPDGTMTARYGFVHSLYREVLYDQLTPGKRAHLHLRIGERLERAYGERAREIAAELALHFEQGRDNRRAIQYLQRAAETALQRFAYHESIGYLTKALASVKALPDVEERARQELLLQASLGPALAATRGLADPEVGKAYTRARELCRQVREAPQLFSAIRGLTMFYSVRADHKTTHELAEQCLNLAQQAQDPIFFLGAYLELGASLFHLGNFVGALKHLEQGIALYDHQKHGSHIFLYGYNFGIACFARAASTLWFLGYPDQAYERTQAALTMAQDQAHPFSLAYALNFAAECHRLRREERITQERAEAAIRLSTEHGFPLWMAGATSFRGWALAEQGMFEDGIAQMYEGLNAWKATAMEIGQPSWLAQLAEAYERMGRVEEGLAVLTEALVVTNKNEERWWEAELHRLKGELFLLSKAQDSKSKVQSPKSDLRKLRLGTKKPQIAMANLEVEAERAFQTALSIARRQQAKSLELRAAMSLARLWQRQGKYTEARQVLSEVYNWFTEGFDTADLQEAKALLYELRVSGVPENLSAQAIH